ncbi:MULTISPECIES: MerR family transcriptional regulator [unclassified Streptomyces]|uniref:MerR family transcriptional regulator n=1 Tax=unclassified Streptomyces TaxID=2593676 RepID=UPI000ACB1AC9|nr:MULTISPECIES: MerR family transcriptional regulator [unclassified Streptomyces]
MKSSENDPPVASMSIGALAGRFGLAPHVLRHWESMGLLAPERGTNGHRRYGHDELVRTAVILRAKEAGLGLQEIRTVLTVQDAEHRKAVLSAHRAALRATVEQAQSRLALVEGALKCAHEDIANCPHFQRVIASLTGEDRQADA